MEFILPNTSGGDVYIIYALHCLPYINVLALQSVHSWSNFAISWIQYLRFAVAGATSSASAATSKVAEGDIIVVNANELEYSRAGLSTGNILR